MSSNLLRLNAGARLIISKFITLPPKAIKGIKENNKALRIKSKNEKADREAER